MEKRCEMGSPKIGYKKENSEENEKLKSTSSNEYNYNIDKNKDELIFDLIKRRYDDELERIKSLDTKAGNLIGYISIVTSLLIGAGTFNILGKLSKPEYYSPYFVAIGLLLVSFIFSLNALKIRKWKVVPATERLIKEYMKPKYDYEAVVSKVLGTMADAVNEIEQKNEMKAVKIGLSWYFLIGGLVAMATYVAIFTATGHLKT